MPPPDDSAEELYEGAPFAYLSTLADGTIIKVNRTFLEWTGYQREALVGRLRLPDLLPPGERIYFETHVSPMLRMQDRVREIAVNLVTASGGRLPVLFNAVLSRDGDGRPSVIRTAMIDASERRAYERELLMARNRAEESEARANALARTLQRTLLPPAMPLIPGFQVAGAFRPAGDGTVIGGDFYDVFETSRGTWAVALGDVCGKGPAAAVVAAFTRYTVRSEALRAASPAEVLTALNRTFMHYHPSELCTILLITLHVTGKGVPMLTLASAGHDLPWLHRADGKLEMLGGHGTIIGVAKMPDLTDTTIILGPGDVVVLCTDGVTEARHAGRFFGKHRAEALILQTAATGPQQIADSLVSAAVDFQHGYARDDIAVLVIQPEPQLQG